MKLRLILVLVTSILASGVYAQMETKKINSIKRNSQYLYGEGTEDTEAAAYETAKEYLLMQINEYVESKKKLNRAENIILKDVGENYEKIQMQRGERIRVFLYVKKNDIIAAENTEILVKAPAPADEGQTEDDKGLTSTYVTIGNDPGTEEGMKENFQLEKAWQQEVINQLCQTASITEARALLARMKAEYKVKRYGNFQDCRNPDASFIIVFDNNGNIKAVLGPGNGQRANYQSGQYDSLNKYSESSAIWFTLSD